MQVFEDQYIDGKWVPSTGTGTIDVIGSASEQVVGRVADGTPADVDAAVAAAAGAFPEWSTTSVEERAAALTRILDGMSARADELAATISAEMGAPLWMAKAVHVGAPLAVCGSFPAILAGFEFESEVGNSLVVREPVGVVGCITPWNYPLHQVVAKVAPALAAGCTVVLKPSEVAPLTACVFAEIVAAAGLPAGVFNLVNGSGPVVGEAIASHPKVDMVSFTGSTRAGRRVGELASQSIKRVALELGGKSANIILDDADLEAAVKGGVENCYANSGQTCTAHTRMLVPRAQLADAERFAQEQAESMALGDPASDDARLGPLVSAVQRDRVRAYIDTGVAEGAKLVTGGSAQPDGLPTGYFVAPTVFSEVTPEMTIAREEIFGPVLSILPYDTEDEAVEIANSTDYGLAGGVWSADQEHALAVARRMRTGMVDINGGAWNPLAPFGGYKQSGNGRELGQYGLEEFLEAKAVQR